MATFGAEKKEVFHSHYNQNFFKFFSYIASWTSWTEWTQCSASCGSGSRLRMRACDGEESLCVGDITETEACEAMDCQGASKDIEYDNKHNLHLYAKWPYFSSLPKI